VHVPRWSPEHRDRSAWQGCTQGNEPAKGQANRAKKGISLIQRPLVHILEIGILLGELHGFACIFTTSREIKENRVHTLTF
jgi:hypothetical protein